MFKAPSTALTLMGLATVLATPTASFAEIRCHFQRTRPYSVHDSRTTCLDVRHCGPVFRPRERYSTELYHLVIRDDFHAQLYETVLPDFQILEVPPPTLIGEFDALAEGQSGTVRIYDQESSGKLLDLSIQEARDSSGYHRGSIEASQARSSWRTTVTCDSATIVQ